ncbi:MAG: tautomerase family protein [Chloroflexi bacterium AL-W]|nr:tautomerase family protein [Chloroflexi bacterium AL-N1]NOK71477.1 tautomerase family protein [Chloroflexi bacterium AL-N10]NOK77258.1 tautomerase family protein [Chloroflexi bacterium AL-N5]NOK86298.1 tautomerase family protein [Chloroflexi bacterium AL-W]NOK93268.1 tautomerase family protein [Chloroflexi bacterium AL-N15]
MAQITIYGLRKHLANKRKTLSDAIHTAVMEAFGLPEEKRFHRFILLDPEDFIFLPDRGKQYTIIELSIFEGRSDDAKRQLIRLLFQNVEQEVGIIAHDLEITLVETPPANGGIRGKVGDELALNYRVDV